MRILIIKNRNIFRNSTLVFSFFLFAFYDTNAQPLETLIEEALSNNPKIQAIDLQYKMASEKANEVNTLPNTEFGVGYFISEPETRTGPQRFNVSVKQMIPWFGTITAKKSYARSLSKAKYEDIIIEKRKLVVATSQSYYRLYAYKAQQNIILQNIELLKTYETLALTALEVDKASAVDILRLQMRQNELEALKQVLDQNYLTEQTILNKLLNRDKNLTVNVTQALTIPTEANSLKTVNLSLHPELIKYDKLYESIAQSELLNQKESLPMIGLGLKYINVEKRPVANLDDNGKDVFMPTVSFSIPIFNKKYKSKTKQNKLREQEIIFQKQERLNTLETMLDKAVKERTSAKINYQTQTKNLRQAKDAQEILIKTYETGAIDFSELLEVEKLRLKFQINQIESIKNYHLQNVIINYLTNSSLMWHIHK